MTVQLAAMGVLMLLQTRTLDLVESLMRSMLSTIESSLLVECPEQTFMLLLE